jgi:hypothetical protein
MPHGRVKETTMDFAMDTNLSIHSFSFLFVCIWARGSVVVKALCYKPEGRGFDTLGGELIFFNLPNLSSRTSPWSLLNL